ncbi:HNH endonuclease domain-containing protein [Methylotuvimicrobium buryatense]|uniref:HNH endonuclease domain-containing protein n=1 Tax=Methylotuvimicrobium buryatense TaxID=95641 RepID=UPI001586CBC7
MAREKRRCFYTGRKITTQNCYLDHVIPQVGFGNNSYKNIVAPCYDANSMKNDKPADEFIRLL